MSRETNGLSRSSKEKLAKLATGVVAVVLISMAVGLLYLYYLLYVALTTPSNTGAVDSMEGVVILMLIIYSIAGTVVYLVIGGGGIWLIGKLRDYYAPTEKHDSNIPEEPESPKIATTFDEESEEATVRVRHPATADALEIRVNDEVRETIENPKQDDAVTVAKKPEENLEVEEKGSK